MFPQMLAEPSARHRPHRIAHRLVNRVAIKPADRRCLAQEVGLVTGDPALHPVVDARGFGAMAAQIFDEVKERFVAFSQVADLGGPVVHLKVDVQRVVRPPGRLHQIVPDALKVARLAARAGGRDHQVATIVEKQRLKARIGEAARPLGQTFIGRQVPGRGGGAAEAECCALEQRSMRRHMALTQSLKTPRLGAVKQFMALGARVGMVVGCRCRDQNS
jgi:hypothetical protein